MVVTKELNKKICPDYNAPEDDWYKSTLITREPIKDLYIMDLESYKEESQVLKACILELINHRYKAYIAIFKGDTSNYIEYVIYEYENTFKLSFDPISDQFIML